tara:strand:+ start:54 stop:683 length:630 start_codon:yes stop_codon:yes gene_type:complete
MTIVSTKKYLFIKVFKTGGTSIWKELLKNDSGAAPLHKLTNPRPFPNKHLPAVMIHHTSHIISSWIKENTFPELGLDWDEYFKFGFVRNPWDRELSNYFYNSGKLKPPEDISFKEWLNINLRKDGLIDTHNIPQCDYLTDVDYIARFENYAEEVKYLFNRIGVPLSQKIFHYNKTEHKPYWEYYDDADIMKVHQWYEKDIEMYNYEFGE